MCDETRNGIQSEPLPAFLTKEVAEMLSISESYLRKWCLELEKHEYIFIKVRYPKSNREYRTFTSKNINIALEKSLIKKLLQIINLYYKQSIFFTKLQLKN